MFGLPPSLMEDTYDDDLIGVAGPGGRSALRRRH